MRTVTIYAIANINPAPVASDVQAMMPVKQLFIPFYAGEAYQFDIVLYKDWETKRPAELPDDIVSWAWYMDRDFDQATEPLVALRNPILNSVLIKVFQTEEETRIRIHCSAFSDQPMIDFLGANSYRDGLHAELVGYGPEYEDTHSASFCIQFDNIMIGRPFDEVPIYAIANTVPAWLRDPQNMMRVENLFFPVTPGQGLVFDFTLFKEELSSAPAVLPEGIVSWAFAIDRDLNRTTEPLVLADNDQITFFQSETETKIRVPCSQMGGQAVLEYIGQTGYRIGLYAELVGYDRCHKPIFFVPIKGIRLGAPEEPGLLPDNPGIL